ncbi:MAG: hypothetical protein DCC71_15395 [Proteobacteria bacterium]|nr:MAG: hypothetical protein DCC71_15395 [Pseudomonadota bacterium]
MRVRRIVDTSRPIGRGVIPSWAPAFAFAARADLTALDVARRRVRRRRHLEAIALAALAGAAVGFVLVELGAALDPHARALDLELAERRADVAASRAALDQELGR